jgi:hypothetical protein
LAAITVSVASSPIFFRIASSPLANSLADVGFGRVAAVFRLARFDHAARRFRVSLIVSSSVWCKCVSGSCSTGSTALPVAVGRAPELLEEAGMAARMAGDAAGLLDLQQHHVLVAVEADFQHLLHMAGFFALVPQLLARAAPVHRFAQLHRPGQRSRFIQANISTSPLPLPGRSPAPGRARPTCTFFSHFALADWLIVRHAIRNSI